MPYYILYLVKVSICLAVVYLFYHFVLRKLTFYAWNRFYLLGYTLFSFFVPFMDISPVLERNSWSQEKMVNWIPVIGHPENSIDQHLASGTNSAFYWIAISMLSGMVFLFLRLCIQSVSFYRMKRRAKRLEAPGLHIYQVDENIIPFSFGNAIYINRDQHSAEELEEIIRHEWVHVKQKHSVDILLAEILCLVNWYNPFAWLLRKSIRQNLEFIADRKVLSAGMDRKAYQYLLLKVTGNYQFSIASQFNFSSLKKRIAMMNKLKSHRVNLLRFLFILPLAAVVLLSFRKNFRQSQSAGDQNILNVSNDTIPGVTEQNSKGYLIDIIDKKGNCTIVVKDRNNKEITRVSLDEWKKKQEYYTNLYGEIIPPPPPAPPAVVIPPNPPAIPVPSTLPDKIRSLNLNKSENKITITLKTGEVETFDMSVPAEKEKLEKKYGPISTPLPPSAPAVSEGFSRLIEVSNNWEITDSKAVINRRDGKTETYDLTDKAQKAEFEKLYGKMRNVATTAPMVTGTNSLNAVSATQPTLVAPGAARGVIGVQADGNMPTLAPVAGRGVNGVQAGGNIQTLAVAPVVSTTNRAGGGTNATQLTLATPTATSVTRDRAYMITGKEDVVVTITPQTTSEELEKMKKQMKSKSVKLEFSNVEFRNGKLVSITGTMQCGKSQSRFQTDDFEVLSLAMVKSGDDVILKVNSK